MIIKLFFLLNNVFLATLASELQSIQYQNNKQFELQSKDLEDLRKNITAVAHDTEEMQRRSEVFSSVEEPAIILLIAFRKLDLESEIIVYGDLLNICSPTEHKLYVTSVSPMASPITRKFLTKAHKKGSVGIREYEKYDKREQKSGVCYFFWRVCI